MTEARVTREMLMKDVNHFVSDSEQLLKSVGTAGNEKAQALLRGIEENLHSAKQRLAELQEGALRSGQQAVRATDAYVHSHPWQSVAAAVGVGAVVGLAMGLMLHRHR